MSPHRGRRPFTTRSGVGVDCSTGETDGPTDYGRGRRSRAVRPEFRRRSDHGRKLVMVQLGLWTSLCQSEGHQLIVLRMTS